MQTDRECMAFVRKHLSTSNLSDALFDLGLRNHYLPASIRSIRRDCKLVGPAMPVRGSAGAAANFTRLLQALEALKVDEVYVCSTPPGEYATWGEQMSYRARIKGAAGAVLSGFHRDSLACEASGFPLFSSGAYGRSGLDHFHITDFRCETQFANGTVVTPGDLIVGDADGVLVIPRQRLTEVVTGAADKARHDEACVQAMLTTRLPP